MDGTSRHEQLAYRVLSSLKKELRKNKIGYLSDKTWSYHILIPLAATGSCVSLFCSGLNKAIDIQELKRDGSPDQRSKEVRYLTPKGTANYIRRKYYVPTTK